jgi:hypothetical protein
LKSVSGGESLSYSSVSDKLANEILQCGIDWFNHCKDSDIDPGSAAMDLAKKAQSLAVGNIAKERCKENIEGIQEWQLRDCYRAIAILESIKHTYKNLTQNQSINITKVKETVQAEITDKIIHKLAFSDKIDLIKEFNNLLAFLDSSMGIGFQNLVYFPFNLTGKTDIFQNMRYQFIEFLFEYNIEKSNQDLSSDDYNRIINVLKSVHTTVGVFGHYSDILYRVIKKNIPNMLINKLAVSDERTAINEFYDLLTYRISCDKNYSDNITLLYNIEQTFCDALPHTSILKTTISEKIKERKQIEEEKRKEQERIEAERRKERERIEAERKEKERIEEEKRRQERERIEKEKRRTVFTFIIILFIVCTITCIIIYNKNKEPEEYRNAWEYMEDLKRAGRPAPESLPYFGPSKKQFRKEHNLK